MHIGGTTLLGDTGMPKDTLQSSECDISIGYDKMVQRADDTYEARIYRVINKCTVI